ncbi:MAG: hypothetical protein ACLR8Y_08005 [Alistipes indistinctus]
MPLLPGVDERYRADRRVFKEDSDGALTRDHEIAEADCIIFSMDFNRDPDGSTA